MVSLIKKFIFLGFVAGLISSCHPVGILTGEETENTIALVETKIYPTPTRMLSTATIKPPAAQEPETTPATSMPVLATLIPPTYEGKELFVLYGDDISQVQGVSDFFERGLLFTKPNLFIYTDGMTIFQDEDGLLWQGVIPVQDQINLLSLIRASRFFEVKSDPALEAGNPIYQIPDDQKDSLNSFYSPIVSKVGIFDQEMFLIRYNNDWQEYLIPEIKNTIDLIEKIQSLEVTPYQPDRLLVMVSTTLNDLVFVDMPPVIWPEGLPTPENRSWDGSYYLEGEDVRHLLEVIEQGNGINNYAVFDYGGELWYTRSIILFPHQCLTRNYRDDPNQTDSQPFFECLDPW